MKQIITSPGLEAAMESKVRKHHAGFAGGLRRAFLLLFVLCLQLPVLAQNITITGVVDDEEGEPLIGASVQIKGTQNGVTTNIDGEYTIMAPANGTLVVSYVGYDPKEVAINGQTTINIHMAANSAQLEELVVVGYGTVKRSDLTGAVSSVDTQKLNAKGASSVIANLQGTAPGVNITQSTGRTGGGFDVEIRGKSSINSNTTPLYVVDGVMCNDIDFLNPQDIERIDVLKDASSTAIYGSRATAGVIIVTTKGGAHVSKENKATISYDGYYGINHVARQPDFMDGAEFYRFRMQRFTAPVIDGKFSEPQPVIGFGSATNISQACIQYVSTDPTQGSALRDMLTKGETYDWPSLVTRDGHQQNHYVGVSGASETASYHFGLGINQEDGIYVGDQSTNISFKGSVDAKINSVISAGFTMNLARLEKDHAYDSAIADAYKLNPFMRPYDADGNPLRKSGDKAALGTDGNQFSDQINPLYRMNDYKSKQRTYRALGNAYLQLNILPVLNIKSVFSPSYTSYRNANYTGYIDPATGLTYGGVDPSTEGWNTAYTDNASSFSWIWDNMINYHQTFADAHNVTFMGLYSMEKHQTEHFIMNVNDVMEETDWWNMGSGTPTSGDTKSSYNENSMISYAVRVNYDYKGKYFFTGTVRWDGSSRFAKGHKWGSFPSAALAWRLSEENFLKDVNWITNLKLRTTYGVTGNNTGVGNYASIVGIGGPIYYPIDGGYVNGFYPGNIVNAEICWEKSHEFNIGLDFGFINNRINGSIEWYNKKSEDLLYEVYLPLETGGGKMKTNIGSVRNRGIELSLNTINITNRNFEWNTTLTLAHNRNKVLQINGETPQALNGSRATGNLFVGHPYNNVYTYIYEGVVDNRDMIVPDTPIAIAKGFTPGSTVRACDYYFAAYGLSEGQPIIRDVNGDGKWTADEDRVVVNAQPAITGSFTSNMTYSLPKKGGQLDFSFSVYTRLGGKVYSPFFADRSYQGSYYCTYNDRGLAKLQRDFYIPMGAVLDAEGIREDGTLINPVYQTYTYYGENPYVNNGTSYGLGASANYYQGHAQGLVNASYCKVKYITLGYTFDKSILRHIGCKQARIYFTVTNPFVFTKYKGFDPEWATAELKNDGPSTISYQIGASLKF